MTLKTDAMPENVPRILLVEDDEFMSSLITFLLERQQMQVIAVADGRAAMQIMDGPVDFDAVLLDLMLPQVAGMDVLAHMQAQSAWANVPVLMVSALDSGAQIARALRAGAADYITKPFNPEELLARLNRLLKAACHVAPGRRP